jgi:hypothetical protein
MLNLAGGHTADRLSIVIRQSADFTVILESQHSANASQYGTECCDQACRHNAL